MPLFLAMHVRIHEHLFGRASHNLNNWPLEKEKTRYHAKPLKNRKWCECEAKSLTSALIKVRHQCLPLYPAAKTVPIISMQVIHFPNFPDLQIK